MILVPLQFLTGIESKCYQNNETVKTKTNKKSKSSNNTITMIPPKNISSSNPKIRNRNKKK